MTPNPTQTPEHRVPAERIRVRGLVQGVGFRPTVWRLAQSLGLHGRVLNDGEGVLIEVAGLQIQQLVDDLNTNCPPLARIDHIERHPLAPVCLEGAPRFDIDLSESGTARTGVVADAATCPDCLKDTLTPSNRRHGYPFTNCTHCGPRLSILRAIPYDRANTSMASFTQCPECQREYESPADRRFHAQPNACPVCGPQIWLEDHNGRQASEDPIRTLSEALTSGQIAAIKGIGGFHLACDAGNPDAVTRLRQRKHRPAKPFALMVTDLTMAKQFASVSNQEAGLMTAPAAPILLLDQKHNSKLVSDPVAPGQNSLGVMLPYTPLHHLLLRAVNRPLVMTSGNRSEEPQCISNEQARQHLAEIADVFLMHDRDIVNRIDDSVQRVMNGQPQTLRRARGLAPSPLPLPPGFATDQELLALGGELKNSFCLIKDDQAILSQHMGDLEEAATGADYEHNLMLYQSLFQHQSETLVIDRHPEYLSSKYGRERASREALQLVETQHHHAHIAACLGDNAWPLDGGPVLGIALDGLGYGQGEQLWGGEFLLADYRQCERLAHLAPVPMIGGTQAMREPWRNTYAHLRRFGQWEPLQARYDDLPLFLFLAEKPLKTLDAMLERGLNCPETSSAGRWFDAVAAALGLCTDRAEYEGQAAMELEALIAPSLLESETGYDFSIEQPAPLWEALLEDLHSGSSVAQISTRFHLGLSQALLGAALRLTREHTLQHVALSGGVFQNRTLLTLLSQSLEQNGLTVLTHHQIPTNDGGLALGQALIALAQSQDNSDMSTPDMSSPNMSTPA